MARDVLAEGWRRHGARRVDSTAVMQSLRNAYPVVIFLSGVVVGAVLVTLSRAPTIASTAPAPIEAVDAVQVRPVERPLAGPDPRVQPVPTSGVDATSAIVAPVSIPVPVPVQVQVQNVQPPKRSGYRGSFTITSRPQGAAVFMNGRRIGTTPLELENLPVGSRAVRVTLEGYDTWSRAVEVVADRRTAIVASLEESRR